MKWWLGAVPYAKNNISTPQVDSEINTGASETGWGATDGFNLTWGFWSAKDKTYHINYLELLALTHTVMIYQDIWKGCEHIRIKFDNTTVTAYVNNMGGIVCDSCNHLLKTMWYYCVNRKVWLSAVHIPGKDNETTDYISRLQNENYEWRLSAFIFERILKIFYCKSEIDLFVSCINCQIDRYASWHPDRNAIAIDAFSIL